MINSNEHNMLIKVHTFTLIVIYKILIVDRKLINGSFDDYFSMVRLF